MSILDRIRWTNVAKLALAIAAGVLIAIGPHGCHPKEQAAPLPRALPPVQSTVDGRQSTVHTRPELRRPRPRHHLHRRPPSPRSVAHSAPPAPQVHAPRLGNERARVPAAPRFRPRRGAGTEEFF
jgi:hypothetical protein